MKTTDKERATAVLAAGIQSMIKAGFSLREIEESVKTMSVKIRDDLKPVKLCFGNPTVEDCIRYGRCTRKPACDE